MKVSLIFVGLLFIALIAYLPQEQIEQTERQIENSPALLLKAQPDLAPLVQRIAMPIRLTIPKIKVDSNLEHVGLTPQGAVAVPKGPASAAWFNVGPRPGAVGSAVIVGHFGWKDGIPAVFDNLHKLRKGDKLHVEGDTGETITFVVRELKTYGENEVAPEVFGSNDGKEHLNLITCQGVWNKTKKSYSKRLVVFTDREI